MGSMAEASKARTEVPAANWLKAYEQRKHADSLSWIRLAESDMDAAWRYGVKLKEIRFTLRDDGWLVMWKGIRSRKRVVTFTFGSTLEEAMRFASYLLSVKDLHWREDKYQ